jgi:hypothetical protein
MRRAAIIAVLGAGCGGGVAGSRAGHAPAQRGHDASLTLTDVGLPEVPEADPHAPPVFVSPARPPGFYRREVCSSEHSPCVTVRETTRDRATTTTRCSDRAWGFTGHRQLRHRDLGTMRVEGALERADVRRVLLRLEPRIRDCLEAAAASLELELGGVIAPAGSAGAVEVTGIAGDQATCVRGLVAASAFPAGDGPTSFVWKLTYRIEDPGTLPPLRCP